MNKLTKRIILGVVIVILAFVAWRLFFVNPPEPELESLSAGRQTVGRELLVLLSTLRSLTLEDQVLDNPEFMSLSDFSVPIMPNPLGRRNPFAPIGVGNIENTDFLLNENPTEDSNESSATTTLNVDADSDI